MQKSTWFHFLPWVGNSIIYEADYIVRREEKIKYLNEQIAEIRSEIIAETKNLEEKASKDWSPEEIAAAKAAFEAGKKTKKAARNV